MSPPEARTRLHEDVQAHLENQAWDEACALLDAAPALVADSFELSWNHGWALFKRGDHDAAIARLGRAIELDPKSAIALWALGVVYAHLDEADMAEDLLGRSLALEESFPAGFELAFLYHRQGRLAEAEARHRRGVERHPAFPDAHLALADFLSDLGREEEAAPHYRKAALLGG